MTEYTKGEMRIIDSDLNFRHLTLGMDEAKSIADVWNFDGNKEANAKRIVLTWNNHDQLVKALEQAKRDMIKMANGAVEKITQISPDVGWDCGDSTAQHYYKAIDKSLAKTRGES